MGMFVKVKEVRTLKEAFVMFREVQSVCLLRNLRKPEKFSR